jgi:hypothetical protein
MSDRPSREQYVHGQFMIGAGFPGKFVAPSDRAEAAATRERLEVGQAMTKTCSIPTVWRDDEMPPPVRYGVFDLSEAKQRMANAQRQAEELMAFLKARRR